MTSVEFRSDPTLIEEAKKRFADPIIKLMFEIAETERPSRRPVAVTADVIGIQLGRTYGYEEGLDALRTLAKAMPEPPPSDDELSSIPQED